MAFECSHEKSDVQKFTETGSIAWCSRCGSLKVANHDGWLRPSLLGEEVHVKVGLGGASSVSRRQAIRSALVERQRDLLTDGAMWLQQEAPEAWLLEILPEIPMQAKTYPPIVFTPSYEFRFTLNLVAGPEAALRSAIEEFPELAQAVAEGEVLVPSEAIDRLIAFAKSRVG